MSAATIAVQDGTLHVLPGAGLAVGAAVDAAAGVGGADRDAAAALDGVRVAIHAYEAAVAAQHEARRAELAGRGPGGWSRTDGGYDDAGTDSVGTDSAGTDSVGESAGEFLGNRLACDATALAGLIAVDQVAALLEARRQVLVVAAVGPEPDALSTRLSREPDRDCRVSDVRAVELAAALRCSPNRARTMAWQARILVLQLPAVHERLAAGRIDSYRARLAAEGWSDIEQRCANAGVDVPAGAVERFQARVLTRGDATLAEYKRGISMAVSMFAPRSEAAVREAAHQSRHVSVTPAGDGMAWLTALLDAPQAARIMQVLEHSARCDTTLQGTPAQRMADALVGAVTGESEVSPAARAAAAEIQVLVSLDALTSGVRVGAMAGSDLVIEGSALDDLMRNGKFRRLLVDDAGRLVDYGRTTYRPPADLADHIRGRDRSCRAPGCSRPARYADLDHTVPWQEGGGTNADNLAALCRTHHVLKTHGGWRYQTQADGTTTWQTPSGMVMSRGPANFREYEPDTPAQAHDPAPDDDAPPF